MTWVSIEGEADDPLPLPPGVSSLAAGRVRVEDVNVIVAGILDPLLAIAVWHCVDD